MSVLKADAETSKREGWIARRHAIAAGLRVIVIVRENGNKGRLDRGRLCNVDNVGQRVAQGRFYEGVWRAL